MAYYSSHPGWSERSNYRKNNPATERLAEAASTVIVGTAAAALIWAALKFGKQDDSNAKGGGSEGDSSVTNPHPNGPTPAPTTTGPGTDHQVTSAIESANAAAIQALVLKDAFQEETRKLEALRRRERGDSEVVLSRGSGRSHFPDDITSRRYGAFPNHYWTEDDTRLTQYGGSSNNWVPGAPSGTPSSSRKHDELNRPISMMNGLAETATAVSDALGKRGGEMGFRTSEFEFQVRINGDSTNTGSVISEDYRSETSPPWQAAPTKPRKSIMSRFTGRGSSTDASGEVQMIAKPAGLISYYPNRIEDEWRMLEQ